MAYTGTYTWTQSGNWNDQTISINIPKSQLPDRPKGGLGTLNYGIEAHCARVSLLETSESGPNWVVKFYAGGGWRNEWGRYSLFWNGASYTLNYILFS